MGYLEPMFDSRRNAPDSETDPNMLGVTDRNDNEKKDSEKKEDVMGTPLLQLGPGPGYTTSYYGDGRRLVAIEATAANPDREASRDGSTRQWWRRAGLSIRRERPTLLDRLLGVDRVEISDEARTLSMRTETPKPALGNALADAARAWIGGQQVALDGLGQVLRRLVQATQATSEPVAVGIAGGAMRTIRRPDGGFVLPPSSSPAEIVRKEGRFESDPQAAQDSSADPGLARHSGLFPDDAGTRRRSRHQQGHRVRACRSLDQEGRAQSRAQQGTLFVHL
jgi:hypothetical protein